VRKYVKTGRATSTNDDIRLLAIGTPEVVTPEVVVFGDLL
jgi:hypothetical protein